MATLCGRRAIAARGSRSPISVRKRPFLTGSAPQTEFDVTRSKQTTEKFLTGARTHIRIFKSGTGRTQNLAQVNRRNRYLSHGSMSLEDSNSFLSRRFIRASFSTNSRFGTNRNIVDQPLSLATSDSRRIADFTFSTRFCPISRKRRNLVKTNAGRISTRGHNRLPVTSETAAASRASLRLHALAGHPTVLGQHECPARISLAPGKDRWRVL